VIVGKVELFRLIGEKKRRKRPARPRGPTAKSRGGEKRRPPIVPGGRTDFRVEAPSQKEERGRPVIFHGQGEEGRKKEGGRDILCRNTKGIRFYKGGGSEPWRKLPPRKKKKGKKKGGGLGRATSPKVPPPPPMGKEGKQERARVFLL